MNPRVDRNWFCCQRTVIFPPRSWYLIPYLLKLRRRRGQLYRMALVAHGEALEFITIIQGLAVMMDTKDKGRYVETD